jgi:hypothetical protein
VPMTMSLRRLARVAALTPAEREAERRAAIRFLDANRPPDAARETRGRAATDQWFGGGNGLPWPTAEECHALFALPCEERAYLSRRYIFGVSIFERWCERTGYVSR